MQDVLNVDIAAVIGFVSGPQNLLQMGLFFAAAVLGRLIAPLLTRNIDAHISDESRWAKVFSLVKPIIALACVGAIVLLETLVLDLQGLPVNTLLLGFQLLAFLVFFMLIHQVTQNRVLSLLIVSVALIPWGYHQLGEWSLLEDHLNKFSVQFGSVKLTPFTLIKGLILLSALGWVASAVVDATTSQIKKSRKMRSNTKALLSKSVEVVVYFVTFVLGLRVLGIDLTAFAVLGGALGVGIGFGLQKITSNFISGIILLLERSIEVNDLIEMDGGIYGFIRQINARFTLIETFDGKEIMVPNEDFVTQRVTNWTYSNSKGRVEIPVGVSYGSDIRLVQQLIIEAAREHEKTVDDPEPVCHLRAFGDSSVDFLLYFFVADVSLGRFQVQSEVMLTIWDKFKDNGIEIPFPQRDIHIKSQAK